ncbi:MAG TPA: hypothetical protein PLH97_11570, partial [Verrucomicrobiota bacterium]|nr:hypothetical protein [Verrucomicrobiota bacterium]
MKLDETQKQQIEAWIREGLKLSEIQSRMASEWNLRMTYMEVRLLVDDLKLTPKDEERAKPPGIADGNHAGAGPAGDSAAQPGGDAAAGAGVSVTVDQLARPGAVVSG